MLEFTLITRLVVGFNWDLGVYRINNNVRAIPAQ